MVEAHPSQLKQRNLHHFYPGLNINGLLCLLMLRPAKSSHISLLFSFKHHLHDREEHPSLLRRTIFYLDAFDLLPLEPTVLSIIVVVHFFTLRTPCFHPIHPIDREIICNGHVYNCPTFFRLPKLKTREQHSRRIL